VLSSGTTRLRRAVGSQLDDLAVRRLRTLAEREATGQPVPPSLAPGVVEAFGAVVGRDDQALPPGAEGLVLSAFERLWDRDFEAVPPSPAVQDMIVRQFHRLYYHSYERTWKDTRYRGVTIWKCPLDLWLYQELLHELRPQLIVETGTAFGGSAYFLGDLCDALVLDSDHSRDHVLDELRAYADLVSVGSYFVVEDTNVNGHPAYPEFGPGPMEAVDAFLAEDDRFEVDAGREKFFMTFNPRGYLRKVRA
jgi:hypothetical protein